MLKQMHPVEHVEEVALGIHPHPLHVTHDLADDLLPHRGIGAFFQPLQISMFTVSEASPQTDEL